MLPFDVKRWRDSRYLVALVAAALVAALSFASIATAAQPTGTYSVQGTNPGGAGSYSGSVTVRQNGETYEVIWIIGSQRYYGTGVGNKSFMAVSYISGDSTGLALYTAEGDNWSGIWTYAGGNQLGTESWRRQ